MHAFKELKESLEDLSEDLDVEDYLKISVGIENAEDGEQDCCYMLETPKDRTQRYKSIAIVFLSGFTYNIAYSLVLTSTYPYLIQVQGEEDGLKTFFGWVISALPLAQLIASPVFGYLGSRFRRVQYLLMITMLFLASGFIFYASIGALPWPRKYYLILARLILGAAAGTITLCLSYVAEATTIRERTRVTSYFSFTMALAFVSGPVIQSSFVGLGETGYQMGSDLYLNVYTAPSWLAALLALFNVILFCPALPIFKEYYIAEKEGEMMAAQAKLKDPNFTLKELPKPDMLALFVVLIICAFANFNFIFLETILTPMVMDFLAWTKNQAILYVGVAFAAGGLYSGIIYGLIGALSQKLNERIVLITGLLFLIAGPVTFLPVGSTLPPRKWKTDEVTETGTGIPGTRTNLSHLTEELVFQTPETLNLTCLRTDSCGDGLHGCPLSQTWCDSVPRTEPFQMLIGFILVCTGYPLGTALSVALYSKIVGPRPQGTWMGILFSAGCLARILCPICVSGLYDSTGTWAAFGFLIGTMVLILILVLVSYRRLVPFRIEPSCDRS